MLKLAPTRHQVAIHGRVTDSQTGRSIQGAEVTINGPAKATRQAAADGHFHVLDLPAGEYTLTASLPGAGSRYGTAQSQAAIAWNGNGIQAPVVVNLALPPTTVKGHILTPAPENPAPVVLAEVRVKGSGERAFTDGEGRYLLAGIEIGRRTLLVTARGHAPPEPATVQLENAGDEKIVNFTL
jgi:hypothetical protein